MMFKTRYLLALYCCLAIIFIVLAAPIRAATGLEMQDLYLLQYADDPVIHPLEEQLIYVRHFNDKENDQTLSNLWQMNFDGSSHQPITKGKHNIHSPSYSPDGRKLAYLSNQDGASRLYIRDLLTAKVQAFDQALNVSQISWSPDSKQIAFSQFILQHKTRKVCPRNDPKVIEAQAYRANGRGYLPRGNTQLMLLNISDSRLTQLTSTAHDHASKISWSSDGKSLYFSANLTAKSELQPANTDIFSLHITSKKIQQLTDFFGHSDNPIISPDGKLLAFTGYQQEYKGYHVAQIYLMNIDGSNLKVLNPSLDRSADNLQWGDDSQSIYFQYDDHGQTFIGKTHLNGEMQTLQGNVGGTQLGRPYSSGTFHLGPKGHIAFTAGRADKPADIALLKNQNFRLLSDLNQPLLTQRKLPILEEENFISSYDGQKIQGWLLKPTDFSADKKYPLILEVHGGPFTNYGSRFSAEAQIMAAKGYLVLYLNPRGSTSYGQEFADLIHHQFPANGYLDLISAVDQVIAKGIVDESRLYISGGSAGGTLASWVIGKTDKFAAAAVIKPVTNWTSQVLYSDIGEYITKHWFATTPWQDPEEYWRRSPISLVEQVKTPTLLLTGEEDFRTPIAETEQYYQALHMQGVETKMVRIPQASHNITQKPSNLIHKILHILNWFDSHVKTHNMGT
jgi:acylaminoacyl-peptidase